MKLFCFGLGYTALALARELAAEGWQVAGTTRDPDKRARLERDGIEVWRFERDRPLEQAERALAGTTHLLSSIAPDEAGDPVLGHHARDLLRCRSIAWAGYLGTTGVYGDRGGDWVSEADPTAPTMPRTVRRTRAEAHWLASGLPVQLFRLSGIYGPGPGRSALAVVRAGSARRVVKPGQVFCRIHVDDIVQVLRASMARPNPGAVYNVADDEPAPPQDVVTFACTLLGVEPPPEIAVRCRRAVADGAQLLQRQPPHLQRADQGGVGRPPALSELSRGPARPARRGGLRLRAARALR